MNNFYDYFTKLSPLMLALILIASLALVFCIVLIAINLREDDIYARMTITCATFFAITFAFSLWMHVDKSITFNKADTYRIMLDGEQVEREDVDLSMYRTTRNDETQTIFLSRY